jgi:hypothetical protein
MAIEKDINNAKKRLIAKAKRKGGVWENFGDDEEHKLRNKYAVGYMGEEGKNRELIDNFFVWRINFDDRKLKAVV